MEYLFVYGSLRKGFWNHEAYLKNSKFVGNGKTKHKYAMYASIIPYVVEDEKISHIIGEVYEVNKETLERIDSLEGHPTCYKRKKVPIILESGKEIEAWLYFYPEPYGVLVKTGDYGDYMRDRHV
ncbi:gamma-glutamylcyclotransferase family protein [Methanotorris formicicus]|uniref:AIG2 family protein n=1 Tax=Methanotorris formicicus Mc-S-70 TaxID=647171 RepID=H1KZH5_9EURY|nr:gamma-glutamylcyclotransferase [Methanotorris formicicus]EHP85983.1 AIG2 family protein [Methanotorris formicicus Mc-S-70]